MYMCGGPGFKFPECYYILLPTVAATYVFRSIMFFLDVDQFFVLKS